MSYQLPIWVWPTALICVCVLALWRGRNDERLAAAAYLLGWALTRIVFQARSEHLQLPVLVIDVATFGIFVWLGLRSGRFWPLFAGGFELLAVVTHLARAADTRVSGWAYLTAELVWSYLVLAAIGYGAWTAPRRYAESGASEPIADPGATLR